MKEEMKVIMLSVCLGVIFMFVFGYFTSIKEHTYYLYQVGIYKDAHNRDEKISALNEKGFDCVYYTKDHKDYVISMISEDRTQIDEHAKQLNGIIKEYKMSSAVSHEELLDLLEKGESYD